MPWKTTDVMDQKKQMIAEWQSGRYSKAALARRFAVSRTTVYEWTGRFKRGGLEGLNEQSRAPRSQPRKTPPEVVEQIVGLRSELPHRGAKKLKAIWEREHPGRRWPAPSTVAGILQRRGLSVARKRKRSMEPRTQPLGHAGEPNAVWCADFKGWFLAGNGERCEPLTLCDARSRYLLRCQLAPHPSYAQVKPVLEAAFREYGLPRAMRTDNGPPFATLARRGLSRLAVWWVKLGIVPERIDPGKPQQNGRLERLHQTLKLEAASPPARTWRLQQQALDRFLQEYNEYRPHEALGQQTPASCYESSPREYPARLGDVEYPPGYARRRVQKGGQFRWASHYIFLTRALRGEVVGLEALDERRRRIWFGPLDLGVLDARQGLIGLTCRHGTPEACAASGASRGGRARRGGSPRRLEAPARYFFLGGLIMMWAPAVPDPISQGALGDPLVDKPVDAAVAKGR